MKKILVMLSFLMALWGCKNLTEEQCREFTYTETTGGFGTAQDFPKVWKLECNEQICHILYKKGDPAQILFQKSIPLDKERKKQFLLAIIKGLKSGQKMNDVQDFSIDNQLVLGDGKTYNENVINQEFIKILKELLGKEYDKIK